MKTQIKNWEAVITKIVASYQKLDAATEAVMLVGAMDIEGPLHSAIWESFSLMLELCDKDDWISWYIFENDCGTKGMKAKGSAKSKMAEIKTPLQLAKIIVGSGEV